MAMSDKDNYGPCFYYDLCVHGINGPGGDHMGTTIHYAYESIHGD
jgi:hypothetical protein